MNQTAIVRGDNYRTRQKTRETGANWVGKRFEINRRPEQKYIKYVYWLTGNEEARLREDMKTRNIKMKPVKGIVCRPLAETFKISSVAPEVWNDTCARQGIWYRASDKNGLHLVISAFELEDYIRQKAATITRSEFRPEKPANRHVEPKFGRLPYNSGVYINMMHRVN